MDSSPNKVNGSIANHTTALSSSGYMSEILWLIRIPWSRWSTRNGETKEIKVDIPPNWSNLSVSHFNVVSLINSTVFFFIIVSGFLPSSRDCTVGEVRDSTRLLFLGSTRHRTFYERIFCKDSVRSPIHRILPRFLP